MNERTMIVTPTPQVFREAFDSEEEYLFHKSICEALTRSWEESQLPGARTYTHEEVWEELRKTYGISRNTIWSTVQKQGRTFMTSLHIFLSSTPARQSGSMTNSPAR